MNRPEPILPENEREMLLTIYENPGVHYDTFNFTDMLSFPGVTDPGATRMTPEYAAAFKETVRTIESLVEKGLLDGNQRKPSSGMYYTDLKIKFKGKQTAIREKRRIEELKGQMEEFEKRAQEVFDEISKAEEEK